MTAPVAEARPTGAPLQRRHLLPALALAVIVLLLATYPLWASGYQLGIARDALIFGILALSLDFLLGQGGGIVRTGRLLRAGRLFGRDPRAADRRRQRFHRKPAAGLALAPARRGGRLFSAL